MKLRASRLAFRLLAFNIVLVFLPIAGVLFLGEYEERLETAEIRDVTHRARLIAASIARGGTLDEDAFEDVIHRAKIDDLRVRRKFEDADPAFDRIETVYGLGYRWKE